MATNPPERLGEPLAALFPQVGDAHGDPIEIRTPLARIGQGPQNEIVLDDDTVSTNHATLEFGDGAWRLTDLESRNGTYVDGERLAPRVPTPLPDAVDLAFGAMKLGFRTIEGAEPEAARAEYTPPGRRVGLADHPPRFRVPVWLALLVLFVLAALVFLFFYFGTPPVPTEPVTEPATAPVAAEAAAGAPRLRAA